MVDNPMIAIERGIRSGYGVFVDGKLAVASRDAEGALVGVAAVLDVNLLQLLRQDKSVKEATEETIAVHIAALAVTNFMIGINATDRKVSAIKAIRGATGCGLKPAKDALEEALRGDG